MVDLTARPEGLAPPVRFTGIGQRVFWQVYDLTVLTLMIIAMADMPNRWGGLAPVVWLAVYLLVLGRVLMMWRSFYQMLVRNWTLLLYPAVALMSVIWSGSRGTTLVGGVQLTMSVLIAMYIGWRFSPRQLVVAFCTIVTTAAALGLMNWLTGVFQPVYSDVGGLLGIYTNKNMLGHYSQMAAVLALTVLLMRPGQVPRLLRLAAPLAFAICAVAVVLSKSMTAVLLMPCYVGLLLLLNRKRLPLALRHGAIATIVLLISLGPLVLAMFGIDPLQEVFRATGKDATLTGRTDLWSIAAHVAAQAPLIGQGFGAFWAMDQFAPERYAVIEAGAVTAASFHNFMADIMVGTGLLGLAAMFALIGTVLSRTWRYYLASGSALAVGCLVTSLMPINIGLVETYMYRQHELMLSWMVMLAVSIASHAPPFIRYPSRGPAVDESE